MAETVAGFYAGKHIFITGSTGFMGKVLVEKLLRSCPNIATIYLLIRPKKGKTPASRIGDITKSEIFDKIRATNPNHEALLSKLHCISGDVQQANLSLSNDDQQLLRENVEFVFHMAANVRFDQPLKTALLSNTGGTYNVLTVAEHFQKLKGFIHVSTSYCHCDQTVLEEKVYFAPQSPRKMLDLVSWLDEDKIDLLTPKLLNNAPNTYAYTKCLTEQLVSEYAKKMPIAIARPSIVTACLKEPIAGWVDNFNGPTGLLIGAGKGVIRTMHCDPQLPADLVPVDIAINGLILIGKELGSKKHIGETTVVNVTSGRDNQIKWGDAVDIGRKHFYDNPFSICLWYPGGSIKSNYFIHIMAVFFFHIVPAYLVDFLLVLCRGKPFLVRTQKRIQTGLDVLQYYTIRDWHFRNDKLKAMAANLSDDDRRQFYVDFFAIDWDKYILNSVLGARQYCVKEKPDTIPHARKVLQRLYYLDLAKNIVLAMLLGWLFISWAPTILRIPNSISAIF